MQGGKDRVNGATAGLPRLPKRGGMALPRSLCFPLLLLCGCIFLGGCGSSDSSSHEDEASRTNLVLASVKEPPLKGRKGKPPKDLVVKELREGTGIEARKGDALATKFVSKFYAGQRFESSWEKGREPFIFKLGSKESNPGWEKGLQGMKVGGMRELIIPPDMSSRFGTLPSGRTLVYVVELIGVLPPEIVERQEPKVVPPKGAPPKDLQVRDLIPGSGAEVEQGDVLTVEYVGIRYDGKPFTNSWDRDKPFRFKLGAGSVKVNPGWEEGLKGMRVGGRRELVIPPKLLTPNGPEQGSSPSDTLVYVIDLIGITEAQDAKRPQQPESSGGQGS